MYEFKDEYLTGIKQIDSEHRRLFEIANNLYELEQSEYIPDKYDNIKKALEELKEYTAIHFANEEEYMRSINYKKMFTQKIQHEEFKNKINDWDIDAIDESQDQIITDILKIVTDWLVNHILYTDKQIPAPIE